MSDGFDTCLNGERLFDCDITMPVARCRSHAKPIDVRVPCREAPLHDGPAGRESQRGA